MLINPLRTSYLNTKQVVITDYCVNQESGLE